MEKFEYATPTTVEEACELLAEYGGDAAVLAGGQSLLPLLRQRVAGYQQVVDINGLPDRDYVERDGDQIRIGCLARHRDVAESPVVDDHCHVLAETAAEIGDRQVRNWGTICGSIAHADPSGDPPVVATALDADIVAASTDGERVLSGASFFHGFYESELAKEELVTEVRFPVVERPRGAAYVKYEPSAGAYPVATVAAVVELDGDEVRDATLVTGAIEPGPTPVPEAAETLVGEAATSENFAAAGEVVGEEADPIEDTDGDAAFKRELIKTLARRALDTAAERSRGDA